MPRKFKGAPLQLNALTANMSSLAINNAAPKTELLFSNIDAMPTNTQETVLRAAFEKLLGQYKTTHSDIINNPKYSGERFFKLLETVRDKLFSNIKPDVNLEGVESLKNTYNQPGDSSRRLKLEKKYVSPQNSHSKLYPDEALVMFDIQVYKFDKIVKKIITPRNVGTYKKEQTYFTLFKAIFEITMQLLASKIVQSDEAIRALNVTVPIITDYYLIINGKDIKVVIEMEYIENKPLKNKEQLLRAHEALTLLREKYKIFHNDSHRDNIRYIPESDIVVLFDWDVASIGPSKTQETSRKGITLSKAAINDDYFGDWVNPKKFDPFSAEVTLGGKPKKKTFKNHGYASQKSLNKTKKKTFKKSLNKKTKKTKKTKKMKKMKKMKKTKKTKKHK